MYSMPSYPNEPGNSRFTTFFKVTHPAGCDMRADFVLTHADKSKTVLEVKTVVDTDYDAQLHQVCNINSIRDRASISLCFTPKNDDQDVEGGSKKKKPKKDGSVVKYLSHAKPYKVRNIFYHQN